MLAKIINNVLIEDYKVLIIQSHFTKFFIVLHCYICLMETKVYIQDAVIQQTAVGINTCFKYFKKQDNYTIINKDVFILNIAFLLYCIFKASNATSFNKWLQVIDLSKGQQLLHLVGVLDSDRNLYPIADPNMTKYAEFR